jgi:hypothetical protein
MLSNTEIIYGLTGLLLLATVPYGMLCVFTKEGRAIIDFKKSMSWNLLIAVVIGWTAIHLFQTQAPDNEAQKALKWAQNVTDLWAAGNPREAIEKLTQAANSRPWENENQ